MSNRIFRVGLGLILAPLTILPVVAIFGVLTDFESIGDPNYWKWLALFAMYGLGIAWVTTVAVGLPIYLLMLRLRYSSYLEFGIAGALAAIVGGWYFLNPSSDSHDLEFMCLFAVVGATVALALRRIAGDQANVSVAVKSSSLSDD